MCFFEWLTSISSRDHSSTSIFIITCTILTVSHLFLIPIFLILLLSFIHIRFDPTNSRLECHVMLWSESARVFPLFCILLLALLLLPELFECHNVFTLLLIDQFVNFFLNLKSKIFLIELVRINQHWYFDLILRIMFNICHCLLLLFFEDFLHVI
jgi:hypothetical protein